MWANKKRPVKQGPTRRCHHESEEEESYFYAPSSDDGSSDAQMGDDDDGAIKTSYVVPSGRTWRLKKMDKRQWYDPQRADAHL